MTPQRQPLLLAEPHVPSRRAARRCCIIVSSVLRSSGTCAGETPAVTPETKDGRGETDRPKDKPPYRVETASILMAADAAPKPLSILTTTTPGAQHASAECNAVVPPAATP